MVSQDDIEVIEKRMWMLQNLGIDEGDAGELEPKPAARDVYPQYGNPSSSYGAVSSDTSQDRYDHDGSFVGRNPFDLQGVAAYRREDA